MDLNELFFRQQIERSRADTAASSEVRKMHDALARELEKRIAAAGRAGTQAGGPTQPQGDSAGPRPNAFMAVTMTARQVGR
jgi:hypothetical protein